VAAALLSAGEETPPALPPSLPHDKTQVVASHAAETVALQNDAVVVHPSLFPSLPPFLLHANRPQRTALPPFLPPVLPLEILLLPSLPHHEKEGVGRRDAGAAGAAANAVEEEGEEGGEEEEAGLLGRLRAKKEEDRLWKGGWMGKRVVVVVKMSVSSVKVKRRKARQMDLRTKKSVLPPSLPSSLLLPTSMIMMNRRRQSSPSSPSLPPSLPPIHRRR